MRIKNKLTIEEMQKEIIEFFNNASKDIHKEGCSEDNYNDQSIQDAYKKREMRSEKLRNRGTK